MTAYNDAPLAVTPPPCHVVPDKLSPNSIQMTLSQYSVHQSHSLMSRDKQTPAYIDANRPQSKLDDIQKQVDICKTSLDFDKIALKARAQSNHSALLLQNAKRERHEGDGDMKVEKSNVDLMQMYQGGKQQPGIIVTHEEHLKHIEKLLEEVTNENQTESTVLQVDIGEQRPSHNPVPEILDQEAT